MRIADCRNNGILAVSKTGQRLGRIPSDSESLYPRTSACTSFPYARIRFAQFTNKSPGADRVMVERIAIEPFLARLYELRPLSTL